MTKRVRESLMPILIGAAALWFALAPTDVRAGEVALQFRTPEKESRIGTLKGKDLVTGEKVSLDRLKGQVVVLDIWATWCGPCVAELPDLIRFQKENARRKFTYIGLSVDDIKNKKEVEAFAKAKRINYPVFIVNRDVVRMLGKAIGEPISGIPTKIVIDREGKIAFFVVGSPSISATTREAFEARLEQLIAAPIPGEQAARSTP